MSNKKKGIVSLPKLSAEMDKNSPKKIVERYSHYQLKRGICFYLKIFGYFLGIAATIFFVCLKDWSSLLPYYRLNDTKDIEAYLDGLDSYAVIKRESLTASTVTISVRDIGDILFFRADLSDVPEDQKKEYTFYYRFLENDKTESDILAVFAWEADRPLPNCDLTVEKYPDFVQRDFREKISADDIQISLDDIYLFRIVSEKRPIWIYIATYCVMVALILISMNAHKWDFVQKRCAIGKQLCKYGPWKTIRDEFVKDAEDALYLEFPCFIGRQYVAFPRTVSYRGQRNMQLHVYKIHEIDELTCWLCHPDIDDRFQLHFRMTDGISFYMYVYMEREHILEVIHQLVGASKDEESFKKMINLAMIGLVPHKSNRTPISLKTP